MDEVYPCISSPHGPIVVMNKTKERNQNDLKLWTEKDKNFTKKKF